VLREATSQAVDGTRAGAFLSGGTDSSTVTGMIGAVTGQAPRSFSIGFDAQGYDEMEYARIAARHFHTDHHEYYVTPSDVVDAVPRIAAAYDQPFGNASAVPTYYCARLARECGVERLLGGDGGNRQDAKQRPGALCLIPTALRSLIIEPIRDRRWSRVPIVRRPKLRIRRVTMPARYRPRTCSAPGRACLRASSY
jgi:asparagine synthase (glutamine-hydrolysing)